MIPVPTPQQHALVAQMLQGAVGPRVNPFVQQQASRYLPEVPDPNAQGDWSYNQPWLNTPQVVQPGYGTPHGPTVMEDAPAQATHASVFGQMRQMLPDATRSGIHSHQQALIERFMRNAQAAGMKGVRKK